MSRWLSLYWMWLLPALAALATLARWRAFRAAHRRGLLSPAGRRWLLVALAAAQALIWQTQLSLTYSTALEWPIGGLAALGVMLMALRAARAGAHPGLHGFQRPLPRDGLELIERERQTSPVCKSGEVLRRFWPLFPALGLLFYLAASVPARRFDFALLGLVLTAPLWLIPYRRQWLAPILLAPALLILLEHAFTLRAALPPGQWVTPLTGARCTGPVKAVAGQAWCLSAFTGAVYQFDLTTGVVSREAHVLEGARLFALTDASAWVQQVPARGLMRVSNGQVEFVPVRSAHSGAADPSGRVWVIDAGAELSVYAEGQASLLNSANGLLNNTADVVKVSPQGEVWVGSISGVSVLRAGQWETYDRSAGIPGAVINVAFPPEADGSAWLMWRVSPGYSALSDWGVSLLTAEGVQRHLELGALTGLEAPRVEDALAVDGEGRLWFVTQSIPRREKYLGVATPDASVDLYSLGRFATSGPYRYGGSGLWQTSFGVVADGAGGILVYNGEAQPWRHWRP